MSAVHEVTDLLVYVRAVHFAATIFATGTVFFLLLVAEPAFVAAPDNLSAARTALRHRCLWLVWTGLILAVLSGLAWLALLAANIYGAPIDEVWRNGGIATVLTETRFGQVWLIRLILAALLALTLAAPPTAAMATGWRFVQLALAAGLLIGPAWSGHAGATPGLGGLFHLVADMFHLFAAGAWLGGLPPLVLLLAAARRDKADWSGVITAAVGRFSLLGMVSVAALLASGIVNSWYEVGTIEGLLETAYGRLVLLKLALFAAMVGIAAINRFYLTSRLAAAGPLRQLQRNSVAETVLGFAAVVAVGFLGTMAPASHVHQHPVYGALPADAAFVHIHAEQGMADVTIAPGRAGPVHATIRLWNGDLGPLDAQQLSLTLTAPASGSKPATYAAALDSDGAWQVDGIELAGPGNWTVKVDAALDAKRRLVLDAPIVIAPAQ